MDFQLENPKYFSFIGSEPLFKTKKVIILYSIEFGKNKYWGSGYFFSFSIKQIGSADR